MRERRMARIEEAPTASEEKRITSAAVDAEERDKLKQLQVRDKLKQLRL